MCAASAPRHALLQLILLTAPVQAVYWLQGKKGQSCNDVCPTSCLEDAKYYPKDSEELARILEVTDLPACKKLHSGGQRYDPSVEDGNCGFKRSETAPAKKDFCEAKPPPSAQRFCPCSGSTVRGSLTLEFQVQCPPKTKASKRRASFACKVTKDDRPIDWTTTRRTLCCCEEGIGCVEKKSILKAASSVKVGMVLEQAFSDGVGVRRDHFSLVPPPEEVSVEGPGAEAIKWDFNLEAASKEELKGLDCHRLEEALNSIDWTKNFVKAADEEEVPLPYIVDVHSVGCKDRVCNKWQFSEQGVTELLSADRQKWCCDVRQVGCAPSYFWVWILIVVALNIIVFVLIVFWHWNSCHFSPKSGYKQLALNSVSPS